LSQHLTEMVLKAFIYDSKQWKTVPTKCLEFSDANIIQLTNTYLEDKRYWNLQDFDNHLDDITKDWFNKTLFK